MNKNQDDLLRKIIEALKIHMNLIAKQNFPDGQTIQSFMYMVVKRKPRK